MKKSNNNNNNNAITYHSSYIVAMTPEVYSDFLLQCTELKLEWSPNVWLATKRHKQFHKCLSIEHRRKTNEKHFKIIIITNYRAINSVMQKLKFERKNKNGKKCSSLKVALFMQARSPRHSSIGQMAANGTST